ncbi:acetyl transferase [Pochonia chlamydosporia 170]|uniref:Acetyl transferase n=1 Tax=Pochonia chlamydosporia 170 TaxID=1380566 RepID=A0A179F230_METCM|nr:acetyl transferase [Pochonia chlamydosporia 170]OAQ59173.1 acetyl transferase [Pochonia chlamydosporia 170]
MSQLGWFGSYALGYVPQPWRQPPQYDSFFTQLIEWAKHAITISDFVSGNMGRGGEYDPNLWTIPMEFTCSLFIFLALLAFSRLKPSARLRLEIFIVLYCLYYAYWQMFLFCGGMLLCDWSFYLTQIVPESTWGGSIIRIKPMVKIWGKVVDKYCQLRHAVWAASLILAIHVLGMPAVGYGLENSPGFKTLSTLVPANYAGAPTDFWMSLGAVWLILTIDRSPWLQKVFSMRIPQYLGKISFSLYLVHGPILYTLGWHLLKWCTKWTDDETNLQYGLGICIAACGFWPVVIWVADFVTRRVDTPAVRFGQWAYSELVWKEEEDSNLEMALIGS